ncbi:hypothetical protein [Flavicella sp.]|uniref:hypothetical protein n=1 Tax=Flavicella sp. TaxID=2957742 RepID=UPI00301991F7
MNKSEFHLQKALLKTEILIQEKVVEDKFRDTTSFQNIILTIVPSIAKQIIHIQGKKLLGSFFVVLNSLLVDVLFESKKVIVNITNLVDLFKDISSKVKEKSHKKE